MYDFDRKIYQWLTKYSSCREFEVDSINFAGQTHRWRLSGLLQRGRDRRRDTLLTDLALATRFLVVTARARLISHCFSVSQSLKALITGLLRLLGEQSASFLRFYAYARALYVMRVVRRLNVTYPHYQRCITYIYLCILYISMLYIYSIYVFCRYYNWRPIASGA